MVCRGARARVGKMMEDAVEEHGHVLLLAARAAPAVLHTDIQGAPTPSQEQPEGELGGTGSSGTGDAGSSGGAACPASERAAPT